MSLHEGYDLIITIVKKGFSENILKASREAGAEGGTILFGRGAGIHEKSKIMGIPIEPEKEIVFTIIRKNLTNKVVDAIVKAGKLTEPGKGICFVLEVKQVAGICHVTEEL